MAEDAAAAARELAGVAHRVSVILPWGGLLRTLVVGERAGLESLAALARRGGSVELVFSYDGERDAALRSPIPALALRRDHLGGALPSLYRRAGLAIARVEQIDARALRAYPTTWAKRLAYGRPRPVWRIRARRI